MIMLYDVFETYLISLNSELKPWLIVRTPIKWTGMSCFCFSFSLATRPIYKYVCHFLFTFFFFFFFFFFSFTFYFLIQCLASLWVNFSSVVVSEILEIQTILSID